MIEKELIEYGTANLNVLMIGDHGVGKTAMVTKVASDLGLKLKYLSASTLDPFADLVGVPKPVDHEDGTGSLKYYRPQDLNDCEFLFIDELNRAHPKVLNAVLELVQFKAINGESLPRLKMVWAAINPPGGRYSGAASLDPALMDRFHCHVEVVANPRVEIYTARGIKEDTAKQMIGWWQKLDPATQVHVTPRRLEMIGLMHDKGLPLDRVLPWGVNAPLTLLKDALVGSVETLDRGMLSAPIKKVELIGRMAGDIALQLEISNLIAPTKFNAILDYNDYLKAMSPEVRGEFFDRVRGRAAGRFNDFVTRALLKDAPEWSKVFPGRELAAQEWISLAESVGVSLKY